MAASIRRSRRTSRSIGALSRLSPSSAIWLTAEPGRFPLPRWRAQPHGRSTWRVTPGGSIAASPTAMRRQRAATGGEADRWRAAHSVFVVAGLAARLVWPVRTPDRTGGDRRAVRSRLVGGRDPTDRRTTQDPLPPQSACSRGRRCVGLSGSAPSKKNQHPRGWDCKNCRKPFLQFLQCRAPGM